MFQIDPNRLVTEQGREEWLRARRQGLGSSDAGPVCGLSRYASPLHVYLDKMGELPHADSKRLQWGRKLEALVAQAYEEEYGVATRLPTSAILQDPNHPFMLASVDRMATIEHQDCIVELKTAENDRDFGLEGSDDIPDLYNCQVQHQLAVTDLPFAEVVVLFAWRELRVYHVVRNERFISKLRAIEADFWDMVIKRQAPEPEWGHPGTPELLREMFAVDTAQEMQLTSSQEALARDYLRHHKAMQESQDAKILAKSQLLWAMGPAASAVGVSGIRLSRKRISRKGFTVEPTNFVNFRVKGPQGEEG